MTSKIFNAISLSRKAGRLVLGFDAVCDSVASGEARLVLFAKDVSPGTQKRMLAFIEETCPAYTVPYEQTDLAMITRKPVGVMAVADVGLAKLCLSAIKQAFPEQEACCSQNVVKGGTAGKS